MKEFRSLLPVLGVLFSLVGGCAAGDIATAKPKEDAIESDKNTDDSADTADGDGGTASSTEDRSVDDTSSDSDGGTPTKEEEPAPAKSVTHNGTCNSEADGHASTTKVTWEVSDSGAITLTKLTLLVTNSGDRNKNDVDVYMTPAGGSEKMLFNSGDILTANKEVTVKWPSGTGLKKGARLRFSTNFDEFFIDPSASCTVAM